jgi:nucleotide-binding universal stress UspA family protein
MNTTNETETRGIIVVGVDGSEHSCDALRWAVSEAAVRNDTVRAVYAYGYPYVPAPDGAAVYLDPVKVAADAEATLSATLARAIADPVVRDGIERVVIEGGGAERLIEQSKAADLLVVGARGHGGFVGLLLGSVSTQCVNHSKCPVVVVPPAD